MWSWSMDNARKAGFQTTIATKFNPKEKLRKEVIHTSSKLL